MQRTHVVLLRFADPADAPEARRRLESLEGTVPSLRSLHVGLDVLRGEASYDLALTTTHDGLDGLAGTAVTVQRMVFGNAGGKSGAGVGFTCDPASGERRLYLDFAAHAQGEDVVSGRVGLANAAGLERLMPPLYAELREVARRLEAAFLDAQDFEFTIEDGKLFLLQTRRAKRTAWAALKIAVELVEEGALDQLDRLTRRYTRHPHHYGHVSRAEQAARETRRYAEGP